MRVVDDQVIARLKDYQNALVELPALARELDWPLSTLRTFVYYHGFSRKPAEPEHLDPRKLQRITMELITGQISEEQAIKKLRAYLQRIIGSRPHEAKIRTKSVPTGNIDEVVDKYRRGEILSPWAVAEALNCSDTTAVNLLTERGVYRTIEENLRLIEEKLLSPDALEIFSNIKEIINSNKTA